MKQTIALCIVAACCSALLFLTCMQPMSGNGSDVGNPTAALTGHLIDGRTKTPAQGAVVRVYPVYLNKMAKALGKVATGAPAIDSTHTDHDGFYRFDSLANGIYSVESEKIDAADTLTARHPSVIFIGTLDLGYDTLQLPGSIKGKVAVPGGESAQGITCYIPGTSYIAITNDTGGFLITGIPAGTYSLAFSSTKFNDTTIYGLKVVADHETPAGTIPLGLDRSKNEHDVWGVFDSTTNYRAVRRIEAQVTGDSIPLDSPRVYTLDWRPDVEGYSGFIYVPADGLFWMVAVCVYDALDHRIGTFQIQINRSTGDIQFPSFNPCNGIPAIALHDTTVSIYDSVPLRPSITKLADDSIVSMAWDIGNTGTFVSTTKKDTLITAPRDSAIIPCVFRCTDKFGNVAVQTAQVTVVVDPPKAILGNDTTVNANDSFSVHYSGTDGYGRIVKYRLDTNNDGVFEDSSSIPGSKRYKAPSKAGSDTVVLQVQDDDGNKTKDTMIVHVVVHVLDSGLVAYWSFDSSSGNTFYDVTGHGYYAVATGTGVGLAPGVSGQALSCPGSGYEIAVANSVNNFNQNKFTVESWFYSNIDPSGYDLGALIFCNLYIPGSGGPNNGYNVYIEPTGRAVLAMSSSDGNDWEQVWSSDVITAQTWYLITATYDSSYMKIYVNGVLSGSTFYQGTYPPPGADAGIGCQRRQDGIIYCPLNGRIDELKLYNYALSADSIAAHYAASHP